MDLSLPHVKPDSRNPHGDDAAMRTTASDFCRRFASYVGRVPFFYQMSAADQRKGNAGSRSYYWAKDFTSEASMEMPGEGNLVVMIDVDYYIDMNAFLSSHFLPVLIYTFQPEAVSDEHHYQSSFAFNHDNEVMVSVSGSAQYQHRVWSYQTDSIMVTFSFFGIRLITSTYLIDRRSIGRHREIVLLTPLERWFWPEAPLIPWIVNTGPLSYYKVNDGEFNVLQVKREDGMFVSIGRPASYNSIAIPSRLHDGFMDMSISKYGLQVATIAKQIMPYLSGDNIHLDANTHGAMLKNYFSTKVVRPMLTVFPVTHAVKRYRYNDTSPIEDKKTAVVAFMSPLVDGAFSPDISVGNAERAVAKRIVELGADVKMTRFISNCIDEFLAILIPTPHVGHPVDITEVFDRQSRPSQRVLLNLADYDVAKRIVTSFIKSEAYSGVKDPRVISPVNAVDKRDWSMFTYSFADFLKTEQWYAFGRPPVEIASLVASVCSQACHSVTKTDYSRWDGWYGDILREFHRRMYLRYFSIIWHSIVMDLFDSGFDMPGNLMGVRYNTESKINSGKANTSIDGSTGNKFIAYLAHRMSKVNGRFKTPFEAYYSPGIYGGDDGLTADIDPEIYLKASRSVGTRLKAEPVLRGSFGIEFLSRMYGPDIWTGDPVSCCDIVRQLSKLHTTVNLPDNVTPEAKLYTKVLSYLPSDKNTPVMGTYCEKAFFLFRKKYDLQYRTKLQHQAWDSRRYWDFFNFDVQYPNEPRDWIDEYVIAALTEHCGFDFEGWMEWMEAVKDIDDLLKSPCFGEIIPSITEEVIINEELHGVAPGKRSEDKKSSDSKRKTSIKRGERGHQKRDAKRRN
jgi:hypothetical protein